MVIITDDSERTTESAGSRFRVKFGLPKFAQSRKPSGSSCTTTRVSSKKLHRRNRRVSFDDREHIICLVRPSCELSISEIAERWWRPKDIEHTRANARSKAREARSEAKARGSGFEPKTSVDHGYSTARYMALTMNEDEVEDTLNNIVNVMNPQLVEWSKNPDTCRGLEHWYSRNHWEGRRETIGDLNQLCRELQKCFVRDTHVDNWPAQFEEYSRPSRILARMLGHADEIAANSVSEV